MATLTMRREVGREMHEDAGFVAPRFDPTVALGTAFSLGPGEVSTRFPKLHVFKGREVWRRQIEYSTITVPPRLKCVLPRHQLDLGLQDSSNILFPPLRPSHHFAFPPCLLGREHSRVAANDILHRHT